MNKANNIYGDEEVFVVPFHNLQHIDNGYTWSKHDKNIWTKFDKIGKYVYRDSAEGIYVLQQIIPYIILRNEEGNYLAYTHLESNDNRTSNKMSIGFEKHINPEEAGMNNVLFRGAASVLMDNQLFNNISNPLKFVGYVRDMSEQNADHLGCVFIFDCKEEDLNISDKTWLTKDDLIANYHKFESWSKFIIDHLVDNTL